jgi:hypothetical protein
VPINTRISLIVNLTVHCLRNTLFVLEITFWRVRWNISWSADKCNRTKPYGAIHYVTTSKDNYRHGYISFFSLIDFLSFHFQHHYLFAQHISVSFLLYIGSEVIFKHSATQQ